LLEVGFCNFFSMFFLSVSIGIPFLNPKALFQGFILTPCESHDSFIVRRSKTRHIGKLEIINIFFIRFFSISFDNIMLRLKNSGVKSIL